MALITTMNSALGGIRAHDTWLEVVGNNIANVNTTGFKNSRVYFSDAFWQTLRMGTAASGTSGGVNPMQVGLGVQVAAILPQFTQGELQLTGIASDLAVEGDGFFKVETADGIRFTRSGAFRLNLNNELVDPNGAILHGYMADTNYSVTPTDDSTTALTINIGGQTILMPTTSVKLQGNLDPDTGRSTGGQKIQSARLYNTTTGNDAEGADLLTAVSTTSGVGGAALIASTDSILVAVQKGGRLISPPTNSPVERFTYGVDGTTVADFASWLEDKFGIQTGTDLYSHQRTNGTMTGGSTLTVGDTNRNFLNLGVRVGDTIYFSSGSNAGEVRTVSAVAANTLTFTTALTTAATANDTYEVYAPAGVQVDVLEADDASGGSTTTLVDAGVNFVTDGVQVGDVIYFNSGAESGNTAVVTAVAANTLTFAAMTTGPSSGNYYSVRRAGDVQGAFVVRSNLGTVNAFSNITTQKASDGSNLFSYTERTAATGASSRTLFPVIDSLGNKHDVNISWVLSRQTGTTSIWEAFFESDNNNSITNTNNNAGNRGIRIGYDRLTFDSEGDFVTSSSSSNQATLTLAAQGVSSPLIFSTSYSGAGFKMQAAAVGESDTNDSAVNVYDNDGKALGVLEGFSVGEDGIVTGVFSNGISKTLAQVAISRFMNTNGLVDKGRGLFQIAPNSGPVQTGTPMTNGRGRMIGGALEASNVDLAKEFTDMIVAQRGFQANARTISTADELLQELVNLRR